MRIEANTLRFNDRALLKNECRELDRDLRTRVEEIKKKAEQMLDFSFN